MPCQFANPLLPHEIDSLPRPLADRVHATLQDTEEKAFLELDDTAATLERRLADIASQLSTLRRHVCVLVGRRGVKTRARTMLTLLDDVLADARGED
jgi:hypothetical protein